MDYFQLYRDCWTFHKEHSKVLDTEEYWESVMKKSVDIAKKHGNSKFARDILISIICELERIAKEARGNGEHSV